MQQAYRLVLPLCLLATISTSLFAQAQPQHPAKSTPSPTTMGAPDASTPLGAAWQRFLAEHSDGKWWSYWSHATGTPKAIVGSGLPLQGWHLNTLDEAREYSAQLLNQQSDLLGLSNSEFRESIGSHMGKTWVLVYDQYFHGLPVIGGRADVRVHEVGRIPMFGSTAFQIPATFNTQPTISELDATRLAWEQVGFVLSDVTQPSNPRNPVAPRLVIWGDLLANQRAPVNLAWEIPISNVDANGVGPIGRYYIDAMTGGVLHYTNDKHECAFEQPAGDDVPALDASADKVGGDDESAPLAISGTVYCWTRTGLTATDALVNVPVAGMGINVPGVGTVYTDAGGNFGFTSNIFNPFPVCTFWMQGVHCQLVQGPNSPTIAVQLSPGNWLIQMSNSAPGQAEAAHASTYYWVYTENEWWRTIFGNSGQLNNLNNVLPTVNIASTCNAYYTGNTINFYAAGGGCNNTGFSTVVAHEYGHGLDDQYGGISNNSGDGLSEGWADISAMYLTDQPIVGANFFTNGGFVRTGNNGTIYPPPSEVHAAGEVWMGFAWQLRERMASYYGHFGIGRSYAVSVTNSIVLGSIVANATDQLGALLQVFVADDDNGNLADGTPHEADIRWAANVKNYPDWLAAPPSNDECSGAIQVFNGTQGPYDNSLALDSDPPWNCGVGTKDVWFKYLAGNGTLTVTTCGLTGVDTQIEIFSGSCGSLTSIGCDDDSCSSFQSTVSVPVTAGWYYIRVGAYWNNHGAFSLNVSGPPGAYGTATPYGTGCYLESRSFYDYFPNMGNFNLNSHSVRLVNLGNHYRVEAGNPYVAPSASANLIARGDDTETAIPAGGTFIYPGGSTNTFYVCMNGFVSMATGNGTPYFSSPAGWVAFPQAAYGTWHDFNSSAAASGQVKYETIAGVTYVTWDNVYSFGSTNPSRWQLQFNLANGNVNMIWVSLNTTGTTTGEQFVIGYTASGGSVDAGSTDILSSIPFLTGTVDLLPLTLSAGATVPSFGTTVTLTTSNYPAGSTLGVLVESLVQINPGIDLGGIGMPGCLQLLSTGVNNLQLPSGGSSSMNIFIPNNTGLFGLPVSTQTYAFAPGANALGIVSSNGVQLVIGL